MKYLIHSMKGLGDNVFQRIFVSELVSRGHSVWITTPWPEIYQDIKGVYFVKQETRLRTQTKNLNITDVDWHEAPKSAREIALGYGSRDFARGTSIVRAMEKSVPLTNGFKMNLPEYPMPKLVLDGLNGDTRPIALIRPVTVRKEWCNSARNPIPEYIEYCSRRLRKDFHVVMVADLDDAAEWLLPPFPPCDQAFTCGELGIKDLLSLTQHASVAVGGVGWILPVAIAYQTPLYCILGGQGGHNSPRRVTDPRMNLTSVRWGMPDKLCMCTDMLHECTKTISSLEVTFEKFLKQKPRHLHDHHEPSPASLLCHPAMVP